MAYNYMWGLGAEGQFNGYANNIWAVFLRNFYVAEHARELKKLAEVEASCCKVKQVMADGLGWTKTHSTTMDDWNWWTDSWFLPNWDAYLGVGSFEMSIPGHPISIACCGQTCCARGQFTLKVRNIYAFGTFSSGRWKDWIANAFEFNDSIGTPFETADERSVDWEYCWPKNCK